MSNPDTNQLSRTLQQSLQNVLNEVSFDGNRLMGPASSSAPSFNPLLQQNFHRFSFMGSTPSSVSATSSALQAALGASASGSSSLFPSSQTAASFAGLGGSAGGSLSTTMRPSQALGMSTQELLMAAATEQRMIEQTQRVAVARQQALASKTLESRRLYNESLLAFMKGGGAAAAGPSNNGLVRLMNGTASNGLMQQGLMQHYASKPIPPSSALAAASVPQMAETQSKTAIKVLGTSLRKKDSPYLDVSGLQDPDISDKRTRGGVTEPFPEKLHRMLEEVKAEGKDDIVSFFSHGRAFAVHDPDRFTNEVMPKYFKQKRLSSFQRQLNLYGFTRITSGSDAGGYYHELFLQGRPNLAVHMRRVGLPQGEDRRKMRAKSMRSEPDFYSMCHVRDAKVNIPGMRGVGM